MKSFELHGKEYIPAIPPQNRIEFFIKDMERSIAEFGFNPVYAEGMSLALKKAKIWFENELAVIEQEATV